jgi:hypothetical protein
VYHRFVLSLVYSLLLLTAGLPEQTAAIAGQLSPDLIESLKAIPVPHTSLFIKHHGELVEHNTELASRCFECHQNKRQFCVGCHAVYYDEEERGESEEAETEDWERHSIGHEDIGEDISLFERLGIPLDLKASK